MWEVGNGKTMWEVGDWCIKCRRLDIVGFTIWDVSF